jgi:XTP/dITP diphosphohydrolase
MREFDVPEPVEDGDTFEANALIKARACARATGLPAIADDSGLEVDAWTALLASSAPVRREPSDDAANNAKLVAALADVAPEQRTARFVCAAALVLPDGDEVTVRGTMEGHIVDHPGATTASATTPTSSVTRAGDGRTNAELASLGEGRHQPPGCGLPRPRPTSGASDG